MSKRALCDVCGAVHVEGGAHMFNSPRPVSTTANKPSVSVSKPANTRPSVTNPVSTAANSERDTLRDEIESLKARVTALEAALSEPKDRKTYMRDLMRAKRAKRREQDQAPPE